MAVVAWRNPPGAADHVAGPLPVEANQGQLLSQSRGRQEGLPIPQLKARDAVAVRERLTEHIGLAVVDGHGHSGRRRLRLELRRPHDNLRRRAFGCERNPPNGHIDSGCPGLGMAGVEDVKPRCGRARDSDAVGRGQVWRQRPKRLLPYQDRRRARRRRGRVVGVIDDLTDKGLRRQLIERKGECQVGLGQPDGNLV